MISNKTKIVKIISHIVFLLECLSLFTGGANGAFPLATPKVYTSLYMFGGSIYLAIFGGVISKAGLDSCLESIGTSPC